MRLKIKIGLHIGFIVATCFFGLSFYRNYSRLMNDHSFDHIPSDPTDVRLPNATAKPPPNTGYSNLLASFGLFVGSAIALGFLVARDVSLLVGYHAAKALFNDEGEGIKNPEYELAEASWADGRHLEAIQMMRDYLKKNPREQHVALRIAEIYEKDLQNYLAAALEYEELLKQKLAPEQWGWSAIHLCNLYSSKLNQTDKALALLRRIDSEHGETVAAEKARKRLAMYDSGGAEALVEESASGNQNPTG